MVETSHRAFMKAGGMQEAQYNHPRRKRDSKVVPCHFVIQVIMQQPLIKLPGKAPTIALPFIGPIIGPKPRDVDFMVYLKYNEVNVRYNPTQMIILHKLLMTYISRRFQ